MNVPRGADKIAAMAYLYYFTQAVSSLAIVLLLVGAVVACTRVRGLAVGSQLAGAACVATSVAMTYLLPVHTAPKTYQLTPVWVWRTEQILSSVGLMLFALGYLIERTRARAK